MSIFPSSRFRSGSLFALLMCFMIGTVRADALMEFLQERTPPANNGRVTYVSHQEDPLLQMIQNLDALTGDQEFPELHYTRNNAFHPALSSTAAMVVDAQSGQVLYHKNSSAQMPIASITKLMTAIVVLDAQQNLQQMITVSTDDIDRLKNSGSRLAIGTALSREEMLHLGLMSSENRAMHALARAYPGGMQAFLQAMNDKARALGMNNTVFYDPTGLNPRNQSTAQDLVRLVQAAYEYPLIRQFSTSTDGAVLSTRGKVLHYKNSNALVRGGEWKIDLQKTGYIRESGRSMVVRATIEKRPLIIVLLDAPTAFRRVNDAQTLRTMVTSGAM
ncbi:MAG: serine hydrolase [Neisseria sp.]|nr:serine hydrolase [Neisseria sp.]